MTLDLALAAAKSFDPWETVAVEMEESEGKRLAPDMFEPPTRPPDDSMYAPLPNGNGPPPPWFRDVAGGETTGEHNAFRHYLALGPLRTMRAAAEELGVGYSTVSRWARKFNWNARAAAYDTYHDEQYEQVLLERVKEMAGRHATIFSAALDGLSAAFLPLADPEAVAEELEGLGIARRMQLAIQAAKAMPALAQAERLSLGMPTEISERKDTKVIRHEASLGDLQRILSGLIDANVIGKVSSRAGEIIDVEEIVEETG